MSPSVSGNGALLGGATKGMVSAGTVMLGRPEWVHGNDMIGFPVWSENDKSGYESGFSNAKWSCITAYSSLEVI